MPERRCHHVLDRPFLAVGEFDFDSFLRRFLAFAWCLPALGANLRPAFTRSLAARCAWFRRLLHADAGGLLALLAQFILDRFAVPFGVSEVVVSLYEVVDREVVLAVVQAGSASDDLLEFQVSGVHSTMKVEPSAL